MCQSAFRRGAGFHGRSQPFAQIADGWNRLGAVWLTVVLVVVHWRIPRHGLSVSGIFHSVNLASKLK